MAVGVVAAIGLLIALMVLGRVESTDMEEHARWMAQLREEGAWVMW